jgi:hypothetical protein
MLGDPREYRRHALRCAELAVFARTPQLKATFLGLSKNWEQFAVELEDPCGRLEQTKVRSKTRQSLAETKRLVNLLLLQK